MSVRVGLSALLLALGGCAVAMPSATFGSTTPGQRTDVVLGGAARVARGELRPSAAGGSSNQRAAVDAQGVVPVVSARYGLSEHFDLGVVASGTGLRFDVRGERVLRSGSTRVALVAGLGPSYTYVVAPSGDDGGGHLLALEPIAVIGVDFGGLYDFWIGPRLSVGGLVGTFDDAGGNAASARALRLDAGGVFGLAAGLRRVHAFVELSVLYEGWWGSQGGATVDRHGLVLLPALGLRIRI